MTTPTDVSATSGQPPLVIDGIELEQQTFGSIRPGVPTLVFLHEGLGSVGLWREFPANLAEVTELPALVYSRRGNGYSVPLDAPRKTDYMHVEAQKTLPAVLRSCRIERPILVGHSDGASIALIHAGTWPDAQLGVVAIAPHLFVEPLAVTSIRETKVAYETTDLRARMARRHADVDNTFYGWNDIWLHPDFLKWNIEEFASRITCPVLAIQGYDDEYGTMRQVDRLAELASTVYVERLAECRHSPHRDQPERLMSLCAGFIDELQRRRNPA